MFNLPGGPFVAAITFSSPISTKAIPIFTVPSYIQMDNITSTGSTTTSVVQGAYWYSSMPDGSAFVMKNAAGSSSVVKSKIDTLGFSVVNEYRDTGQLFGYSITGYTKANPGVVNSEYAYMFKPGDKISLFDVNTKYSAGGVSPTGLHVIKSISGNSITLQSDFSNVFTYDSIGRISLVERDDIPAEPVTNSVTTLLIGTGVQVAGATFHILVA